MSDKHTKKHRLTDEAAKGIIYFDGLNDWAIKEIEELEKTSLAQDKEARKYIGMIKMGRTNIFNGAVGILNNIIDPNQAQAIKHFGERNVVAVIPQYKVQLEKDSQKKEKVYIERGYVPDIAEALIELHCKKCDGKTSKCKVKKLFAALDVPKYDEANKSCPYMYNFW